MARPSVLGAVARVPLRIIHSPFYYLLGGHATDQRLKVLELAASTANDTQKECLRLLKERVLKFDALELRFSEEYINLIKERFTGIATSSSGEGIVTLTNPISPSFCTIVELVDPWGGKYYGLFLNEKAKIMLKTGLTLVLVVVGAVVLCYLTRLTIRWTLKGLKKWDSLVAEEKLVIEKQQQDRDFTTTSPIPTIT